MHKLSDEELVKGCLSGDRFLQTQLYKQYAGKLYAVSLRYCKNKTEAQDVLQDSFIKIYHNMHQYRGACPLEYWMRRIVVNTALNYIKQQKKSFLYFVDLQDRIEQIDDISEENNLMSFYNTEELIAIIQQLATGYQLVFNLYAIEGYSHKEIAEMLGVTESTSKSQYSRARKQIQVLLEKNNNLNQTRLHTNTKSYTVYDEIPKISL